jgi:hypothetical protein
MRMQAIVSPDPVLHKVREGWMVARSWNSKTQGLSMLVARVSGDCYESETATWLSVGKGLC